MLQTLGKNTDVTALIALKPRQVMLATLNMKHDNKACSADQKTHLLHSILQFLQRNGFSKTVKKFRSEAKIDEDGVWNGCPLDLEDMYYKCLETRGHANTKVDSFKEQDLQANDITKKSGDGTRVVSEGTVSMKKKKRNGKTDNDNVASQPGPVDRFSKAEKSEETLTNILVCESNMESKEKKKSKKSFDTVGIEVKQVSSDGLREPADGTVCESRLDESNKKFKNKKEKKSKLVLETSVDNTERHQLEALASTIDNKSKDLVTSEGKSATASDINSSSKDKKKKKGKTLSDSIVDDFEHSDAGGKQVATTTKEKVVEDSRDYRVVNTTNDILLEEKNVKSKSKKRKKDGLIFENLPRGEADELKKGILTTDSKTDDFQTLEKDETNKENKGSKKRKRLASEEKDLQTVNKVAAEECKRRKTEDMGASEANEQLMDVNASLGSDGHADNKSREKNGKVGFNNSQKTPVKELNTQENGNIDRNGGKSAVEKTSNKRNGSVEAKTAFQRVKVNEVEFVDERLKDNSFWAKHGAEFGYGANAQQVLGQVKGRDFRHEKTKKKRGSYRGGQIDLDSHSIKFNYSDED